MTETGFIALPAGLFFFKKATKKKLKYTIWIPRSAKQSMVSITKTNYLFENLAKIGAYEQ